MPISAKAEAAVRNYLLFLEDPTKLVDQDEVDRLESELSHASDPLEKLRVVSRLQRIREGDRDSYRQAFCAHAKSWAEANDIPAASFVELGVDETTLRAAGFTVRTPAPHRTNRRTQRPGQRGSVRVDQIKAAVIEQTHEFTLADIAAAAGGSPMTVRKAVEALVQSGDVERLGPSPNWSQPGRAPIVFRPIGKRGRR